tara:strand:- start:75 stop:725 length:651 start_codon:yes stop_codon:yes gene_type:complete
VPRKISENQGKDLVNEFKSGVSLNDLVQSYGFTKVTIIKYLKRNIEEKKYEILVKNQLDNKDISSKNIRLSEKEIIESSIGNSVENKELKSNGLESEFFEIEPLNYNINEEFQKDLCSISLNSIKFPQMVYMIVDKNIELHTKLLREYTSWNFLPEEDLNRKTIEIYFDIKMAKSICNKDQKVIKVPNTNVFKIVAPLLLSRGISRIVSEEHLISL